MQIPCLCNMQRYLMAVKIMIFDMYRQVYAQGHCKPSACRVRKTVIQKRTFFYIYRLNCKDIDTRMPKSALAFPTTKQLVGFLEAELLSLTSISCKPSRAVYSKPTLFMNGLRDFFLAQHFLLLLLAVLKARKSNNSLMRVYNFCSCSRKNVLQTKVG